MFARQAGVVGAFTDREEDFRRHDEIRPMASGLQPPPQYDLRLTFIISVRGVKEIAPGLNEAVGHRMSRLFVSAPTESLCPKAEF